MSQVAIDMGEKVQYLSGCVENLVDDEHFTANATDGYGNLCEPTEDSGPRNSNICERSFI